METTTKKIEKLTSNNIQDIEKALRNVLSDIKEMVDNTTYKINDESFPVYQIEGDLIWLFTFDNTQMAWLGIRDLKRLKRYINKCVVKKSLVNLNKLSHFITTKILKTDKRVRLNDPKHDQIQKKRKEWIDLRNKADQALAEYKKEKGNYYKNRFEMS